MNTEHDKVPTQNDDLQADNSPSETEYATKRKSEFSLNIDHKLKNIPDYNVVSHKKRRNRISTFAKIMFAIVIIGISILLSLMIIFAAQDVFGINKPDISIQIAIPENSGVSDIANVLKETGVIRSSLLFKAYYKLAQVEGSLNYGSYALNSNMSYDIIVDELQKYSKTKEEVKVTFPEGMTIYEIANKLQKNDVCKASDFIAALNNDSFGFDFEKQVGTNSLKFHKMEGYVFPETYFFFKNDNPIEVAKKFLSVFDQRITPEMQESMNKMGYTLEETLTIASIVQKEAGKTGEMRKVASVYFNRLKNKDIYPNLQACPTRDYANQLKQQMSVIDRKIIDAYNTYEDAGLPPGPICNPGIEAINATLNPEETEYFYFCTNLNSGEFFYAKTLKEHERNIYRAGLL